MKIKKAPVKKLAVPVRYSPQLCLKALCHRAAVDVISSPTYIILIPSSCASQRYDCAKRLSTVTNTGKNKSNKQHCRRQ